MRKEIILELEDRGNPLRFRIREMSATQLESWILRSMLLLSGTGAEIPGGDMAAAAAYLEQQGWRALAGVDYERARPLLDELLGCCTRLVNEGVGMPVNTATADGYIEDARTLFRLRWEAAKLNLGFLQPGDPYASRPETESQAAGRDM